MGAVVAESHYFVFFFLIIRRPPRPPLFPSTTLFRSRSRSSTASRATRCTTAAHGSGSHAPTPRSEEHTSELQSHLTLVCRLLLEKKKKHTRINSRKGEASTRKRRTCRHRQI